MDAGCSLEDSCPPDKFRAFRAAHPDHIALTYINCSTEVKALSDVIVTSSSAEPILAQIPPEQKIIFGPDRHLGGYLRRKFGRERSEERRVGKECGGTGSYRWSPDNINTEQEKNAKKNRI